MKVESNNLEKITERTKIVRQINESKSNKNNSKSLLRRRINYISV